MTGFKTVRGYTGEKRLMEETGLTTAMEDYVEMLRRLSPNGAPVKSGDLARALSVSDPSASKMAGRLAALGLIAHEKHGALTLTAEGQKLGDRLLARHREVESLLLNLGIRREVLRQVELIEHHFTEEAMARIAGFNRYVRENPGNFVSFWKDV